MRSGGHEPLAASGPALADDEVPSSGEADGVAAGSRAEVDSSRGLVVLVVILAADEAVTSQVEVGGVSIGVGKRSGEGGRDAG